MRRILLCLLFLTGCDPGASAAAGTSATGAGSDSPSTHVPVRVPSRTQRAQREPAPKGSSPACPADMSLVQGSYCPAVTQVCLERPKVIGGSGKHHCARYAPATCAAPTRRRPLRFCMDRYEWPNRRGELPRTLVSWPEAREMCAAARKRLCTADELTFACEGEGMKAHVYGDDRDSTKCNFDREYRARTFNYRRWDECMADPACKKEYQRLDQRRPAGSMPECVSDHGVYDLNGNVNEWVFRTDQRHPKRSGLKGGWWGPVRNRCRPMTTFHLEGDYGYEVGFRCCRDAGR